MTRVARMLWATLGAALVLAGSPAGAQEQGWTPTPAGWVSGGVQHVTTVTDDAGTAGDAVVHGEHLYVTTWRSFSIYDISDPRSPDRLSTTHLGMAVYNENPQTNGEILLLSRDAQYLPRIPGAPPGGAVLDLYDVRDKGNPQYLSTYASTRRDHLWTCVLDCAYAYSASGTILDLRDPANPSAVGDWSKQAPYRPQRFHHINEVAPGVVMTGSLPVYVLDARETPTAPAVLLAVEPETTVPLQGINMPESLPARVDWPGATTGRLALISMETPFSGPCNDQSGDFQTFLTTGWRSSGTFQAADSYQIASNGVFADGRPPANVVGCSAYGLDASPGFGNAGGLVSLTFFEHGVRVLDVDARGRIVEHGGFLPHAGNSAAPRWITDDVLYVVDLHRGIDILQVAPRR